MVYNGRIFSLGQGAMIELREVRGRRELRSFVRFPFQLYSGNPYWIPPLVSDDLNTLDLTRNPAAAFCRARYWMAFDDDEPVGRVAGIINERYIESGGTDMRDSVGSILSTTRKSRRLSLARWKTGLAPKE